MTMDKTFDAAEAEPRIYARWEKEGRFRAGANATPGAEPFSIVIPPPNVTGSLHMGHALNNTLQDVLTRWKRMQGFDVLWQPGTDHAGIATQMVTEREMAANGEPSRREMGRERFVQRVWEQKRRSRGTIIGQLKRLGASCDWSREAFTMGGAPGDPEASADAPNFHDAVIRAFVEMHGKGLIFRGKRLVNWDPHFETAISDLEVEQVETDGHLWRLRYPLENGATYEHVETDEDGNETLRETRDYLVVATTRPETMLGDTGVAVHPEDPRYAHLIGKTVRLPLVGRPIPIVADEYADPRKGTGAVKITPAHDFNDWEVGKRTGLAAINVMTPKAAMFLKDNADFLAGAVRGEASAVIEALEGVDRYEARDWIVETARAGGWLDGIDADRHIVPHGDRSKVAIEPYLTDQWFVDSAKIVGPAIEAARDGRTTILPEQDAKVYFHWLENIEPWCVSRQLWWGHQIPVWYDEDGAQYCAATEEEARAKAGGKSLTRDPDVLDTWFSSGIWPIGTLGWPEQTDELGRYFPTSVLITGFDIIFFWVARMMMMQLELVKDVPFRTVYVHALVRDEHGKKMSKSLGNVIDPLDLIDRYGADAVRFTLTAMAAMGRDLKLSVDRVEGYRNFATKLWNAARFAQMNGCAPSPDFDPATCREPVNRWIVGETARLRETMDAALEAFRFNDAANAAYAHVWGVFCDWYLECAKPLLQGENEAPREETRLCAAWALDQCLKLLHPVMPFVTEELWGALAQRETPLVHADWPAYASADLADPQADADMAWTISVIEAVRSVKAEMNIAPGAQLPLVAVDADEAARARLDRTAPLVMRLARISDIGHAEAAPQGAVTLAVEGAALCLPLAGVVDVEAERARLDKALAKLARERGGLESKLANPAFLEKAKAEVVDKERARLATLSEERLRLEAAAARLAELA